MSQRLSRVQIHHTRESVDYETPTEGWLMLGGKLMQQQKVWKELSACVRKVDHTPFLLQNMGERINKVPATRQKNIDFHRD